jgi:hypothetical protein
MGGVGETYSGVFEGASALAVHRHGFACIEIMPILSVALQTIYRG